MRSTRSFVVTAWRGEEQEKGRMDRKGRRSLMLKQLVDLWRRPAPGAIKKVEGGGQVGARNYCTLGQPAVNSNLIS